MNKPKFDQLVNDFEQSQQALTSANQANTEAQVAAATAKANLQAAITSAEQAVSAIKTYVSGLDADGNESTAPVEVVTQDTVAGATDSDVEVVNKAASEG